MKVRAIDFVVVNVSDVQRAVGFYRDTLGVDVPLWEESPRWQEFQTAPVAFALREDKRNPGANAAITLAVADVYAAAEAPERKSMAAPPAARDGQARMRSGPLPRR